MQKLNMELARLYQGGARALALAFKRLAGDGEADHWERLCTVANALQSELGLPAPAVSISGAGAYGLWLSLQPAVTAEQGHALLAALCRAYGPGVEPGDALALPPRQDAASGKWAAFIHPGMGASFAGDEGLEVEPPEAGQVALLEGLASISAAQFAQALGKMRPPAAPAPPAAEGLLLKDATLEDIVAFLHSKNIEPTFHFRL